MLIVNLLRNFVRIYNSRFNVRFGGRKSNVVKCKKSTNQKVKGHTILFRMKL